MKGSDILAKKSFLKSDNKIYILNQNINQLDDITSSFVDIDNITQVEYQSYGMDNLNGVNHTHLDSLNKPISVLYYQDNIDNFTPIPKLRQEYDLNVGCRVMLKKPV